MTGDDSQVPALRVSCLARFAVTTGNTERLVGFWSAAFGCREISRTPRRPEHPSRVRLSLGNSIVDILEFERAGRPYPPQLSPFSNAFQHFAIVVSDMQQACERLLNVPDWSAISVGGPQKLPATSGGVTAFKFRDPDGHPLEFLSFSSPRTPSLWKSAPGNAACLGIDHSAVSVADAARSIAFYRDLGIEVSARSFNHGIEQAMLDGIEDPQVDVIGLAPAQSTPHVELLCYRNVTERRHIDIQVNDVFASRLIFESDGAPAQHEPRTLIDPDGHYLEICPP